MNVVKEINTGIPGMPTYRIKREGPLYHDNPDSFYYYVDKRCRFLWWTFWTFQTYEQRPGQWSMQFYSLEQAERYIEEQARGYSTLVWVDKQRQWIKDNPPPTDIIKEIWVVKEKP